MDKNSVKFEELGLKEETLDAIKKKGFETASEIQAKVIPIILEDEHDVVAVSQTGSGKTAAFGLPMIDRLSGKCKTPRVIVLCPTRELALQVTKELSTFTSNKHLRFTTVYGGASISSQISDLRRGVDVVVGTPGRVLDLISRRVLKLENIEYFVLDEADEMLKMGFVEDIETIMGETPQEKRVLLFSATMPDRIKELSKKYMQNQKIVEVKRKEQTNKNIEQVYYKLSYQEKVPTISRIMDMESFFYGIIFCRTKSDVEDVTEQLKSRGYDADCIHGDITQNKREKILKRFKDLKINVLVATDVAARGIDVDSLTHVINHSLPKELDTYVHRIGRTGRAGKKGKAISFVTQRELYLIRNLEKFTKSKIKEENAPQFEEVVQKKKEILTNEVEELILKQKASKHEKLAQDLLGKYEDVQVVSALLHKIQGKIEEIHKDADSLFQNKKQNTNSNSQNGNRKRGNGRAKPRDGETRLFIAKGQRDRFKKQDLLNYIKKESNLDSLNSKNVKVCDTYSFLTVKDREARQILEKLGKKQKGRRALVEIAQ